MHTFKLDFLIVFNKAQGEASSFELDYKYNLSDFIIKTAFFKMSYFNLISQIYSMGHYLEYDWHLRD